MPNELVADDGKIKWNSIGGTMIKDELDLLKQNIDHWIGQSPERIEWLLFEIENLQLRYIPEMEKCLDFNNVDKADIRDTPLDYPKNYPVPPYPRGLDDADAAVRMGDIKYLAYNQAIKWNKEHLEYRWKFTYDLNEQLNKEVENIALANAIIPKQFEELYKMFDDLITHPHMAYTLNARPDEADSTPLVLTDSVEATVGGPDLKVPPGVTLPPGGTPGPTPSGGGGTGGGTGGSGSFRIGLTADSVFVFSAGGQLQGGTIATNDSRFMVYSFVGDTATGTYQIAIELDAGASTAASLQIVPATLDNRVDNKKLLGVLQIKLRTGNVPDAPTSLIFNISKTQQISLTATPGALLGDGQSRKSSLVFKLLGSES